MKVIMRDEVTGEFYSLCEDPGFHDGFPCRHYVDQCEACARQATTVGQLCADCLRRTVQIEE